MKTTIGKIPLEERPRERCLQRGPQCLSLRECLALILGSGPPGIGCMGLAQNILERIGAGLGTTDEQRAFFIAMESSGLAHLKGVSGLGSSGMSRILAAFELGRRYSLFRECNRRPAPSQRRLTSELPSRALEQVSASLRQHAQEWLGFVAVQRSGELSELCVVERGARTHVNVDPAELFARVLALRPRGFFLFHNHPSNDTRPSLQDLDLTERVNRISKQLGLQLLGHWIVGPNSERWLDGDNQFGASQRPML